MADRVDILRRIAADAQSPTALGHRFDRYGGPAPQLGRGRIVMTPRDVSHEPQSSDTSSDPEHVSDADAAAQAQAALTPEQRTRESSLVGKYGGDAPELEDMFGRDPRLSEEDIGHYLQDRPSGITWEDWIGQYSAEKDAGE